MKRKLVVLLSGRGSNFVAIADAISRGEINAEVVTVISNKSDAAGLRTAAERGIAAQAIDHRQFASREEHEEGVRAAIDAAAPDFICLAGYMRRLTPSFVEAYPERIINIHPSLLPSFPGVDAQKQAIEHGVKVTGCTVHFVDRGVDTGPIILQRAIDVLPDDTAESLASRLLPLEHRAYTDALTLLCSRRFRIDGRRVVIGDPAPDEAAK